MADDARPFAPPFRACAHEDSADLRRECRQACSKQGGARAGECPVVKFAEDHFPPRGQEDLAHEWLMRSSALHGTWGIKLRTHRSYFRRNALSFERDQTRAARGEAGDCAFSVPTDTAGEVRCTRFDVVLAAKARCSTRGPTLVGVRCPCYEPRPSPRRPVKDEDAVARTPSLGGEDIELRLAVSRLPEEERQVVERIFGFYDGEECTQRRTATELGVSEAVVAMRLARALKRLRRGWSDPR